MPSVANQNVVRLKKFTSSAVPSQVAESLNTIADRVQRWASKAQGTARTTNGLVRSSPWQAIGAATLVGLATGVVVSQAARRSRRTATRPDAVSEVSGG